MFRRKPNKPEAKKKRAWKEDVAREDNEGEGDDDANGNGNDDAAGAPSEAFLSLQKEFAEKESIQRENEEREKNRETMAAEVARAAVAKEEKRRARAKNSRVFFDIEIAEVTGKEMRLKKGDMVGRIVLELFDDVVPRTAENFRSLCTGEKPRGSSGFPLCYLGNIFHRIRPQFMAQGGDITREDGSGGESIYGSAFDDESFSLAHDKAGLLSMANSGRNTNSSQFFITFAPLPWLDGKHVVFGKVIDGMEVVRQIEDCGTTSGEPTRRVQIAECGQLPDDEPKQKGNDEKNAYLEEQQQQQEEEEEGEEGDRNGRRRGRKRARVRFASTGDDASGSASSGGKGSRKADAFEPGYGDDSHRDEDNSGGRGTSTGGGGGAG